jgi:hypothetical protein
MGQLAALALKITIMIKFFRKIRYDLMNQNKTTKYFKYAIGEIVLVVIGILIALSINNWNQQRLNVKKEYRFLLEIQENLNEDIKNINDILTFNKAKLEAIDAAFNFMSQMGENPKLGKDFSSLLPIITNYSLFSSTKVAFNNITSTGNIDILRSDELRKNISTYYSNLTLNGVQDQLKITSQNFLGHVAPLMINKEMMAFVTKREFDVMPLEDISVHKEPLVLSDLFILLNKTLEHNKLLNQTIGDIKLIIKAIENYLVKN